MPIRSLYRAFGRCPVTGLRAAGLLVALLGLAGCGVLPEVAYQPQMHNPFPQMSKVAVVPFFNLSTDASVDGRQFALAYFNELQAVPGFEVVPIGVVEQAMATYQLGLESPEEAQRLAQALGVDAVVIGAVTDYSPYYPPRLAMKVEWYAANPQFHPIPPGYGLPWGTSAEEDIPASLIFDAEFALAKAQLETQTPPFTTAELPPPVLPSEESDEAAEGLALQHTEEISVPEGGGPLADASMRVNLPPGWPDPRGFIPQPPRRQPVPGEPSTRPVLQHVRTYRGNDPDFTTALETYVYFRDEARFGGWQAYLQRSDDFIRFCCHLHIAELLTARGGAGESRVVWRWRPSR